MQKEFAREVQAEVATNLQSQNVFNRQHEQLIAAGSTIDQSFYPSANLNNSKMNLDDLKSFGGKENSQMHNNPL